MNYVEYRGKRYLVRVAFHKKNGYMSFCGSSLLEKMKSDGDGLIFREETIPVLEFVSHFVKDENMDLPDDEFEKLINETFM